MSETLWDVERLTEATRQSVPMAAQTRVEVVEAERGRVVLRMPLEGNGNHIGTMYAGALFALCEFPGGTLFSTTFDASRYYPIVKGVDISFRKFAGTDITVEASMSEEEAARIAAAAELGDDLSTWRREGQRSGFTPGLIPNDFRSTNRPTYQQVLEFAPVGAGQ